jgi:hypothetical protein
MEIQKTIDKFKTEVERLNTKLVYVNKLEDLIEYIDACETAISAMQELQRYHDVGPTPVQLRLIDDFYRERCEEIHKLTKKKWRYVAKEGNPKREGTYLVTLIFPEWKGGRPTGRTLAAVDIREYADLDNRPGLRDWTMYGEPNEHGLAWVQDKEISFHEERVHAWIGIEEVEAAELPEGVVML